MKLDQGRLRILFFTPWYPTLTDPVTGIFVHELCRSIASQNDVKVIVLSMDDTRRASSFQMTEEVFDGLQVIRLTQGRGAIPKIRFVSRLLSQIWLLNKLISEFKPDIIHATTYHASIPAVIAGHRAGIPVIATEHYSGFYRGMVKGIEKLKARWGLGHADRVISISRYLQGLLEAHGIDARYKTVPIGIDTSLFHPAANGWKANSPLQGVMVASLIPIKGYTYLLDALAILRKQDVPILINVVGDGPDRRMLEQKAVDLGIEEMIKFHGVLRKAEIASLMQSVDFGLSSSLGETFGVGIAEGLATGLPTVASQVGAIPELISDSRGVLVRAADGEELAAGIIKLITKLPDYDRIAIANWAADRFAHEAVAAQFEGICRELMDR